jgi:hypothetical protein
VKPGPVIGLVIGSLAATAQACPVAPEDGGRISDREVVIAWRAEPQPIPIGRHFRLRVLACSTSGVQIQGPLAVDAEMPAHRHGMNYRPSVTRGDDGSFAVEGMLFHMPGHWRITFELGGGMARRRLTADVTIE